MFNRLSVNAVGLRVEGGMTHRQWVNRGRPVASFVDPTDREVLTADWHCLVIETSDEMPGNSVKTGWRGNGGGQRNTQELIAMEMRQRGDEIPFAQIA